VIYSGDHWQADEFVLRLYYNFVQDDLEVFYKVVIQSPICNATYSTIDMRDNPFNRAPDLSCLPSRLIGFTIQGSFLQDVNARNLATCCQNLVYLEIAGSLVEDQTLLKIVKANPKLKHLSIYSVVEIYIG
jgi:hypothetical protein